MKKTYLYRAYTWILSLAVVLVLSGCDAKKFGVTASGTFGPPKKPIKVVVPVEVIRPSRGDVSAYFETTARVQAEARVDVAAQASGPCLKIFAEEGDSVSRGQILAELDKREAQAQLQQAQVQVRGQKVDFDRTSKGYRQGLLTEVELDTARIAYEQGQANLKIQEEQFEHLTIRAPIEGVVEVRSLQAGQLVSVGTPLYTIVDPESFRLIIHVPERDRSRLRLGQMAKVKVDALGEKDYDAIVARINPGVDPTSGTIKVTLDFEASVLSQMMESAFTRVRLVMETREDAILIPKGSVLEENARRFVFIVEEQEVTSEDDSTVKTGDTAATDNATASPTSKLVAKRVEVQIGLEEGNLIEILAGIDMKTQVVTLGQYNLKPDAEVKITTAENEIAAKLDLAADEAIRIAREKRGDDGGAANSKMRDAFMN
jgi:RND family efflux transporter MFP subunit